MRVSGCLSGFSAFELRSVPRRFYIDIQMHRDLNNYVSSTSQLCTSLPLFQRKDFYIALLLILWPPAPCFHDGRVERWASVGVYEVIFSHSS